MFPDKFGKTFTHLDLLIFDYLLPLVMRALVDSHVSLILFCPEQVGQFIAQKTSRTPTQRLMKDPTNEIVFMLVEVSNACCGVRNFGQHVVGCRVVNVDPSVGLLR